MMRTTALLGLAALVVLLTPAGAFPQGGNDTLLLAPEEFAILPWGWTPGDPDVLRQMRECGFNLAGFVRREDLDRVAGAGLKCFLFDPRTHVGDAEAGLSQEEIARRVDTLVGLTRGHPALFGYYLRDEPGRALYGGLKRWVEAFRRAAPEACTYINLFPNYASPAQMNVPTYAEYLESYLSTVRPAFLSYDHYALMSDGSLRGGYFQNLEVVRAAALRHGIPFWNIVLSNAHFDYAEPSEAGLRFQLYTTLAYGGRGISYFTYFAPAVGNYRLAPIDQFGHKTGTWDMLRNVNLQLHRLGHVYVSLRNINVFHHPSVPDGCRGIESSRWIAALTGESLLVGEFEGPSAEPWVLVVNTSLRRSTAFSLAFKEKGETRHLNAYTGAVEAWGGENGWLAPGQGMMLCLMKDHGRGGPAE